MGAPAEVYSPGLEGVIAGETAISTVTGGLRYRGYPVTELAEKATFDEVAYLLLHGELLKVIPAEAHSMDVLRSAVSVMAHFDPETEDCSAEANLRKAERLLGQIPV